MSAGKPIQTPTFRRTTWIGFRVVFSEGSTEQLDPTRVSSEKDDAVFV
jgi:hypothetical protein